MKKLGVLLIVLFLGVFFAISAEQNAGMKEYLGLSDYQEQKMNIMNELCRTQDSICLANLRELRRDLFDEAGKDNPDADKINEIANEIGAQHSMLTLCLVNQIREIKKILTKEQFVKFNEYRQQSKGKRPVQSKPK